MIMNKPGWLNKKIRLNDCLRMRRLLAGLRLHTVCQEALCPNIGECFSSGVATFLILGPVCTRGCRFCGVRTGDPLPPDPGEPDRVAEAVRRLSLRHVVVTSVTRDDLADGGAHLFARTVRRIRERSAQTTIEILIPDFQGNEAALSAVVRARPEVIAHNLESVPRLYLEVRAGADYQRSLEVLRFVKRRDGGIATKSGLMLGLGESSEEVKGLMRDLRGAGVDALTVGQYLAPSTAHLPVAEYIRPEQFEEYRDFALGLGFTQVMSAPYVRSSYRAAPEGLLTNHRVHRIIRPQIGSQPV